MPPVDCTTVVSSIVIFLPANRSMVLAVVAAEMFAFCKISRPATTLILPALLLKAAFKVMSAALTTDALILVTSAATMASIVV